MENRTWIWWAAAGVLGAGAVMLVRGFTFEAAKCVLLCALLVPIAARDAREFRIPNAAVAGVLAAWAVAFSVEWLALPAAGGAAWPDIWAGAGRALGASLLGGVVAAAPVLVLTLIQAWRGREGFGGGDVKLLFAVGLWFTWPEDLIGLFAACVAGAIIGAVRKAKTGESRLPFAVAILAGWWIVMLCGARLVAAVAG